MRHSWMNIGPRFKECTRCGLKKKMSVKFANGKIGDLYIAKNGDEFERIAPKCK